MKTTSSLNFLNQMRLWQKFLLLGLFVAIAVLLPYVQTMRTSQESIDFAQEEISGLVPANAIVKVIQLTQQHRGLSASVLGGITADAAERSAKEKEVYAALTAVEAAIAQDKRSSLKIPMSAIRPEWKALADSVTNGSTDVRKNFDAHVALIARLLLVLELTSDDYKLSLDPNSSTYFLIQAATVHLPTLTELISQGRAIGIGRLGEAKRLRDASTDQSAAVTAADREKLSNILVSIRTSADNTYRFIEKADAIDPAIKARLAAELVTPRQSEKLLSDLVRKEIIENPLPAFDPVEYRRLFTDGLDNQFKLYAAVSDVLSKTLNEQLDDLRSKRLVATLLISAAALAALAVAFLTLRNVTGTVKSLQLAVDKVRDGNAEALEEIASRDEVGDLGRTVNSLLSDRLMAQKKAEQENEALNASVIGLLQAVFQLGDRDLTVRAQVTEDIIGTVASAINQLTDETGRTLREVQAIAKQVEDTAAEVKLQANVVEQTAKDERQSLSRMSGNLTEATEQLMQVASLSETSDKTAQEAGVATLAALAAVNGTVEGMDNLRGSISEMEKRFKRLGERSQEISTAVGLINTISERTHVLALNASMQAATAGEAGRGFAVVAEEVQRLSDSSRQATAQISQLVGNIQSETSETLFTVNRLISDVVQQTALAKSAGQQMAQTQTITSQLVGLVQQIAAFSVQQRELSLALQQSVLDINAGSEKASLAISRQTGNSETLADFSRRLTDAVSQFKVTSSSVSA
jgi:twitching motility protein PilJ